MRECHLTILSKRLEFQRLRILTHSGHNLRLQPKLVLEASSEVRDPALAITRYVWYLTNVIEHVPTGEKQNRDQTDRCPEVAVLNNRQDVRPRNAEKAEYADNASGRYCYLDVVDGPDKWWVGRVREQS